ncbi:MAG: copper chaperone PCu(A)C [Geminicoccales bacterium]
MRSFLVSIYLIFGLFGFASAGEAVQVGAIKISKPWARASLGVNRPAAAYFTLRNTGNTADQLVSVTSPLAEKVSIHITKQDNGIMRMSAAEQLEIRAGKTVELKPGGLHVMMMKLNAPLKKGGTTELHLSFKHAGKVIVHLPIFGPGASAPD